MAKMTGGQAMVESLKAQGVDTVFGIISIHTLDLFDALFDSQDSLRFIGGRHEHGCGFMADGYSRATGKPGVLLTSTGPGAADSVGAIGETYFSSSAVLEITTNVEREFLDGGRLVTHETKDQPGMFRAITDWNATIHHRFHHLQMNSSMNIGIAIALEAGLIVPGISACERKGLLEIAAASTGLIDRANNGTLRNEEYSGTTFSISNLGMFDVESFAAIIYPPHAAVLAVGTVKEQPVAREGQVALAQMMKATLSVDHRVADGAEAAQFLMEIKRLLETPVSLVIY